VKFLLDTCVLSGLRQPKADAGVVQWAAQTDEERLYLSVVTLMEIQKGIAKLPQGVKKVALQNWLDEDLQARFAGRILRVDEDTALTWGTLLAETEKRGAPVPVVDGLVAATAIAHNLTLVTRNTADFERLPVRLLNPWGLAQAL
jgi:predicted nucleic acid-binding protein